ncbi:MAG TPA: MFS transporter, partial [Acidimicrobiales bacterium]|nr:MFS transporter [Acidimicrobiales bacterium]
MIPQPATRDLATTGPLPEIPGGSRGTNRWGALAAICLATFVVVTDFMAVSVALPVVQKDLSASFPQIQWVMEAFVVALTCCVLAAGYVAGRAGPRRVFLAGLAVLSCGSVLAGAAPSVYVLIGARAVQGVGAAMLLATGAVILAEVFRGTDGRIGPGVGVGVWGTATGTALALSPLLGGIIATYLGWRWLFGVVAIASCVALLFGLVTVPSFSGPSFSGPSFSGPSPSGRATAATGSDWRGLALFAAGTAVLVVGLVRTTTTLGSWAQSGVLACLACSGLLLAAFVAVESVSPSPVLDVSLFRRRTFAGSAIAAFGLSMAVLGPFIFLVLYLSYNLGYSTLSIGSHLLFLSGMTLVLLPLAGLFDRHIPVKVVICAGLALVGAGLWLMSRLATNATWADLVPGLIVAGVGLELVNPRLALTAAAAAPPGERSMLSAARASTALRQLGAATGVAVFGSVFATRLSDEISSRISTFPRLSGQGSQIAGLVLDGRTGAAINSAPAPARPALYAVIRTSFTGSMHDVFLVAAGVAAVSAVLALSIRSSDGRRQATAHKEADVVPALAALSAGERPRAQLVPGEPLRPEVEPAGPEPAMVVLEPRLGEDVPGPEIISLDPASIDITSHLFPPVGPTVDELVTVKRSADGAGATGRRNGAPRSGDQEPNS